MLLKLKASYKELTGDAPPGAGPAGGGKKKDKKQDGAGPGAGGGKKEGKKDKGGKEASKPAGKAEGKKEDGGKGNEWRGGSDEVYLYLVEKQFPLFHIQLLVMDKDLKRKQCM